MKVRWRRYGVLLITLITIIAIADYARDAYTTTTRQMESYAAPFVRDGVPFHAFTNRLSPRVFLVLILYACYLWINLLIVPYARKIFVEKRTGRPAPGISWIVLQLALSAFFIALAANIATYYAHPYYYNYAGFGLIALFGYNDRPLSTIFAGLDRAIVLTGLYSACVVVREVVIYYLERPAGKRNYRILITNQVTISVFIFLFIPVLWRSLNWRTEGDYFLEDYFFFLPPFFLVFLIDLFWLFPSKGARLFTDMKGILTLLALTFVCTLPFITLFAHQSFGFFLVFWAVQIGLTTPVSWLVFQQRKDRILQWKGVEERLLKSNADLQSLRAQINPHFLFNALNTLYGTALGEGHSNTATGIQKLGDMMRFMLHDNNQDYIPVSRELEYLENYISLQKLRIEHSPDITIEEHIDGRNCSQRIAPMLLIPLVENAFKHGISLTDASWIKIKLDCDPENIDFVIRNSIHPLSATDPEYEKSGIGLYNIRERLALLYRDKHRFVYGREGNEFVVRLHIRV